MTADVVSQVEWTHNPPDTAGCWLLKVDNGMPEVVVVRTPRGVKDRLYAEWGRDNYFPREHRKSLPIGHVEMANWLWLKVPDSEPVLRERWSQ